MRAQTQPKKDLSTPVQFVKGIGPKRAAALGSQGIHTVRDLLYYFPYGYFDLSKVEKIGNLWRLVHSNQWVTVIGRILKYDLLGRPPRQRFVVVLGDNSATVLLIFFRGVQYFKKAFKVGESIAASGKVTEFGRRLQIVHPSIDRLSGGDDEEGDEDKFLHTRGIVPKYGSSEELRDVNLHVKGLRRIM